MTKNRRRAQNSHYFSQFLQILPDKTRSYSILTGTILCGVSKTTRNQVFVTYRYIYHAIRSKKTAKIGPEVARKQVFRDFNRENSP